MAQPASETVTIYRLCLPASVFTIRAQAKKWAADDIRTDEDGDTWIYWKNDKGEWLLTLTIKEGRFVCPLTNSVEKPAL